jgi:hypothetical protein
MLEGRDPATIGHTTNRHAWTLWTLSTQEMPCHPASRAPRCQAGPLVIALVRETLSLQFTYARVMAGLSLVP